jgi:hypothetical protein
VIGWYRCTEVLNPGPGLARRGLSLISGTNYGSVVTFA